MKFVKMLFAAPIMAISFTLALNASAEDWYVSDDMEYGKGVVSDAHCTNDLQAAASLATSGTTIWVKDGFVWKTGWATAVDKNQGSAPIGTNRVVIANGNVTLRSESGHWSGGATIRGQWDSEKSDGRGLHSIRCLRAKGTVKVIGLRFEDGSSPVNDSDSNAGGGGVFFNSNNSVLSNCLVTGCTAIRGGGVYSGTLYNCVISNNVAKTSGGGCLYSQLVGCIVISNRTTAGSAGGAGGNGRKPTSICARDTVFIGNAAPAGNSAGGGACDMLLQNCLFEGNSAGGYGGGSSGCTSYNCTYLRNVRPSDGANNRGGGAVGGGTHYNCLFAYNAAAAYGGAAYGGTFYNCTAYANTNTMEKGNHSGGFEASDCKVINSISYGNVGLDDNPGIASNSCLQRATIPASWVDCVNVDPRLDAALRPHARVCKRAGLVFEWMTDEADVRSKDLAGNPRIAPGKEKPDMGCYETPFTGLMLIVR